MKQHSFSSAQPNAGALPASLKVPGRPSAAAQPKSSMEFTPDMLAQRARKRLDIRRRREALFGASIFSDPAWDMLLELLVATCEQRRMSVTNLCAVSATSHATAIRWIAILADRGLIQRSPDPIDARRVWVSLTPAAYQQLQALLYDS